MYVCSFDQTIMSVVIVIFYISADDICEIIFLDVFKKHPVSVLV